MLIAALLRSAGCGGGAEKARAKLAQLGKSYSAAEFVVCSGIGDVTAVKLFLDAGMAVGDLDLHEGISGRYARFTRRIELAGGVSLKREIMAVLLNADPVTAYDNLFIRRGVPPA